MEKQEKTDVKDYEIMQRNFPIIISAPHSAKQYRNGKVQNKEMYTDTFAINVADKENVSCIYKTLYKNDDANSDQDSPYKLALKDYIMQNNIRYLVDLHTMSDKRLPDVCIAINAGKNIQNNYELLQGIIDAFNKNGISSVTVDEPFKAADSNCISNYIATNCNIPCFHIEINKKFSGLASLFSSNKDFNKQAIENSLCDAIKVMKNSL